MRIARAEAGPGRRHCADLVAAAVVDLAIVDGRASSPVLIERVARGASAEARAGAAHVAYFLAAAVGRFAVIHRVA